MVVESPTIRIEPPADPAPLRRAIENREAFDWILFTSANGVEAFFGALADAGLDARALARPRIAAMGSATAERLAAFGVRADLVPPTFTTEGLVESLAAQANLKGACVLCPRADIAPKELVERLAACGAQVTELTAYRTAANNEGAERVAAMLARDKVDWLTFTSSSTVKNFFSAVAAETARTSRARSASIGPSTSATLRALRIEPAAEADPHTIDGLVAAILSAEEAERG
jgi:uroporphyrinogen III methyltransferase/synthase